MAAYEVLLNREVNTFTNHSDYFNGLLSDYLEEADCPAEYEQFFRELLEEGDDLRICSGLPIEINQKTISNQIIRYRDAFKLPAGFLHVPYIIYWKSDEAERAIVFSTTNYIEAKGFYFCVSEPTAELSAARNEMLAMVLTPETASDAKDAFKDLYKNKRAVGSVQRSLDRKYYVNVDEMKNRCVAIAEKNFADVQAELLNTPDEEKGKLINTVIGRTFLLKKALYVQYMMSKDLLENRHENEIKNQRQFAKSYVDEIPIVSLSNLWRYGQEEAE